MQWHSWGLFTYEDLVTENNMREMANALISSGMAEAGYDTVNVVCNGWTGRDPTTGVLQENRTLWPSGIAGFARELHAMTPPLKLGCYTAPLVKNCMCGQLPGGGCEEGSLGHEYVDMEFFATSGCDHVMVDSPGESSVADFKNKYAIIGDAIANSSNPNMLYGVWGGGSHKTWKWASSVGGAYWRMANDNYDNWVSLMRQWDTAYSVPNITSYTGPGKYVFLDQMILGDIAGRHGSSYGPGLSYDEAVSHMTLWVMAASPLLTCTDVRNMSVDIKAIMTNTEVLAVHKDPLARMATRVDVGGGSNELRSSHLCATDFPACQEHEGDPGYPGHQCYTCRSNWSIYEKPLHDNSSAIMVFNRGQNNITVDVDLSDFGDSLQVSWSVRDLWAHSDLGVMTNSFNVDVSAHGVRLFRMYPHSLPPPPSPPPPPPLENCPAGWQTHAAGLWSNPTPCGHYPTPANCTTTDTTNHTAALCATKCKKTTGCLAFELFEEKQCSIFLNTLQQPFVPYPGCLTCVLSSSSHEHKTETKTNTTAQSRVTPGFSLGNGTFLLNGTVTRLFAGSLQHFRIHPNHWQHRIALAKAMGLNAVQTLIPWMMMEPTPGEFVTDGFVDIVRFAKMIKEAGLLMVLRPGPFICDGPDFGGLPWWLNRLNTNATTNNYDGGQLRIRSGDPAFHHRVDLFYTKLFALLRGENLVADQGGPIVMAQVDNEYGLFGNDKVYLEAIRNMWRKGLGDGVVIHSTDPSTPEILGGSRLEGILQTVDFGIQGDPASYFAHLRASQRMVSKTPQPLMCSEIYPGTLSYWGDNEFPVIYNPASVAAAIDLLLNETHCGGSTSFALWLFASNTDFGFWGGTLFLGQWKVLLPSYDFGAPVDEAGVIRPLFYLLRDVLQRNGAVIPSTPLPIQPPVKAYGVVCMNESISLWDALPALAPAPVKSTTVRTMEELGQGYGYIIYSTPIPSYEVSPSTTAVVMAGMRDRAHVFLDHELHQTCDRGATVDTSLCTPPLPQTYGPQQLDILVENMGRVTGGLMDAEMQWRGINRYVAVNGQSLANWTISPLPLNNTQALKPLWLPHISSSTSSTTPTPPVFMRGRFVIDVGDLADTFLTLVGWGKGQVWVNGNNLARYWSSKGPQYSFYCPAGFLVEGENEVILLETEGCYTNLTVEFRAAHIVVPTPGPPSPPPPPRPPFENCPAGWQTHAAGLWSNPTPCGHYPTPANCTTTDTTNHTAALCATKCKKTRGCRAFELFEEKQCSIFLNTLQPPFVPYPGCLTCVLESNNNSNRFAQTQTL